MSILFWTNVSYLHSGSRIAGGLGHSGRATRDEVAQVGFARPRRKLHGTLSGYFQRPSGCPGRARIGVRRAFMRGVRSPDDYRSALTVIYCFAGVAVCVANLVQTPGSHHNDFLYYLVCGAIAALG